MSNLQKYRDNQAELGRLMVKRNQTDRDRAKMEKLYNEQDGLAKCADVINYLHANIGE